MLKIVVFDGGWGGEVISNFLAKELQIAEIITVIDWEHAPYENTDINSVRIFAEECLREYIGKVDLIVLAGYTVGLVEEYLRSRYQEQRFACVGVNFYRILKTSHYPNHITAIMNQQLIDTDFCQKLRQSLPYSNLTIPDCSGWEELSNAGELDAHILRGELGSYFHLSPALKPTINADSTRPLIEVIREQKAQQKISVAPAAEAWPPEKRIQSDVVLLLNTNFWDMKEIFEQVFGYRVRILDFRAKLLRDVCATLGLLGVDGNRSK